MTVVVLKEKSINVDELIYPPFIKAERNKWIYFESGTVRTVLYIG